MKKVYEKPEVEAIEFEVIEPITDEFLDGSENFDEW